MEKYDYIILGSGPAGHVSAIKAAQLGLKTAVVEKDPEMFGGVCLNEGCIPAKSLYNSAKTVDLVRNNVGFCDPSGGTITVDIGQMVAKSREDAAVLRMGLEFLFKKNKIDLIHGAGKFTEPGKLEVAPSDGKVMTLEADKFMIATGSMPCMLEGIKCDGKTVITSREAIRLDRVPESLLVVGGGAIGTEFADFFNTLGSAVTIIEAEGRLLPNEDSDISRGMQTIFKKKGIKVLTSTTLDKAEGKFDVTIVSVGRVPRTSALGLETIGIEVDEKGFIPVDSRMRTAAGGVFAAGDVVRTPMLAHAASAEGEVAASIAAGGKVEPVDYCALPNAVYTEVEVASIGITEDEAKETGIKYKAGKQFFKANGRAVVTGNTEGFIKVIAEEGTRKLLGAHILGYGAADLIHEFAVARHAGLTVDDIAHAVHAHPTMSETAVDACRSAFGKPIHG